MENGPTASATGRHKVILLGEHAVVHGTRALGAPLDEHVRVELVRRAGRPFTLAGIEGDGIRDALEQVARQAGAEPGGLEVRVRIGLEAGAGLGGSAALCVAFARAILALEGREAGKDAVVELAQAGERVFHGNPSGIDAWLAASSSPALFARGSRPQAVQVGRELHLAVLVDHARSDTSLMVRGVAERYERDRDGVGRLFAGIESLVLEAAEAVGNGRLEDLGRLMKENHVLLGSLGVTTEGLDRLVDLSMGAGALGAKMTGSGGGGAVIALARERAQAESIVRAGGQEAHSAFTVRIAASGPKT
jgi:mevalonate kinase